MLQDMTQEDLQSKLEMSPENASALQEQIAKIKAMSPVIPKQSTHSDQNQDSVEIDIPDAPAGDGAQASPQQQQEQQPTPG